MKSRMKRGKAVILAVAFLVAVFGLPKTYAALAVKVDEKCTVEIKKPELALEELTTLPVMVNLYKVANVNANGEYIVVEAFDKIYLEDIDLVDPAASWEMKANEVKKIVDENSVSPVITQVVEGESAVIRDVDIGLYLVDVEQALSATKQYDFKPYLVSLPNNYYNGTTNTNDGWIYELIGNDAIKLKPEVTERIGNLVIEKTLEIYNETVGGATFVFQVEAVKDDKLVYSDVVSMTFDAPGKEVVAIKGIPAGATVTVTEIYSGASYELTSEVAKTVTIVADGENEAPATVTFTNTYNEEINGGNGIVNSFTYNSESGEWTHKATKDSIHEE